MGEPAVNVIDITSELVDEHSAQRRDGYDAGLKHGAARYFNSPMMEQLSLELTLTRATLKAVSDTAMQRERLLLHWQTEAKWWREEHDKVHAAYCQFVKDMARRFAK